jgi:predicted GNAT family N-acyltransferase
MIEPLFRVERLSSEHNRATFDCGTPALNQYLQQQATQDARRNVASCFVAVNQSEDLIGYYTLSSSSVYLKDLSSATQKKLPRYPNVPVVRMGRLAVARSVQGQRLGAALLFDALSRVCRSEIAAYALLADAKDEQAAQFYAHQGFERLASTAALTLFLPLASVKSLLSNN